MTGIHTNILGTHYQWTKSRAYRDRDLHAAVNANNGTEALNKVLKYNYLPHNKNMTLSALIVEKFLPDSYQKYLFLNYKQSDMYRTYKSFVPSYLQGRPRSVILHCLERRSKALKYVYFLRCNCA